MFGRKIKLFTLFGFEVSIDASWIIIVVLVTWSLAVGFFPSYYPRLEASTYWAMAAVGALGLFASIIFHEFWHSVVARRMGLPMRGITLFLFGGVSEMTEEPRSARTELWMAAAGPFSSILLGFAFWGVYRWGDSVGWPAPVLGVTAYLAFINFILAAFNLLPAFPLDGGRIIRSLLWRWKKDLTWATRIAASLGAIIGAILIGLGLLNMLAGALVGGLWYLVIGIFLRSAAQSSYRQVVVRQRLQGERVRDLMVRDPVTVAPDLLLTEFVEDFIYKHHHDMYPVLDNGRLVGAVRIKDVRTVPREERGWRKVADVLSPFTAELVLPPDMDLGEALDRMTTSGNSRFLVVEEGRLAGLITLKDVSTAVSVRLQLES
ncbi:site-2 protease family protein [Desulfocurvibacter africanus]|uniref:site-2 protease family protein n=1 Tax=Desulfocurvibacter africanus TaxID=873 RepID=UPI002FDAEBC8